MNNHRPISLLPLPGKLLETLIHTRIYSHLEDQHLLTESQWGFRPGRSTQDAGTSLINIIMDGLNNKQHVGVVYVDLQKAFDSIDHSCLLQKMSMYGIKGPALDWCHSYLSNGKQRVFVNNTSSNYQKITHGVSQGSCLGPLLFLLYINDLCAYIPAEALSLYADDTAIVVCSDTLSELTNKLQLHVDGLHEWCERSKININIGKSKVMYFGRPGISPRGQRPIRLSIKLNA